MTDRLLFIFGEATTALRRNLSMTLAAISTSAVALFVLGAMAWGYVLLSGGSRAIADRLDIRVHLRDSAGAKEVATTAADLRMIGGVRSVAWIPRDKAWQREKRTLPPELTRGVENPLPHAFKVTVKTPGDAERVVNAIAVLPAVEPRNGIRYFKEESRIVEEAIGLLRWLGISVGGLLLLTSAVLIYNTTRMTILARALELRIVRLVGASWITVQTPYLIEGTVTGAMGGVLATALLLAGHAALQLRLTALSALGKLPPLPWQPWFQGLVLTGAAFGFLCSLVAVNRRTDR